MKKDLTFSAVGSKYEATATGVTGAWQLYVELPAGKKGVEVYTRAGDDEQWVKAGADSGLDSEPNIASMAFMSVVEESVKVVTYVMPTKGNIRVEE